jgi:hypothetical protein
MKLKLIVSGILLSLAATANAQLIFPEDYWGGDPTNSNNKYKADVIGKKSVFDITGFRVIQDANADTMRIEIHANYFDDIMANSNDLLGTTMGDLFISTDGLSWDTGGAATLNDYFGQPNATEWDYAVKLGTYKNNNGQLDRFNDGDNENNAFSANVLAITDPNSQIQLSNAGGIFRDDQEHKVKHSAPVVGGADWFFSDDFSFMAITIDQASTIFGDAEEIGFHWTMSCGNDVIEFEVTNINPVPEPATIGILGGLGLFAYLGLRRRLSKKAAAKRA